MGFSHELENKILDHIFGGEDFARPANLQVGLSLTEIQDDGSGITEPETEDGYERVSLANDEATWEEAVTDEEADRGVKVNAIDIVFPEALDNWGTVTHFFVMDGGTLLGHGALQTARMVIVEDVVRFRPGELKITLD